MPAAPEPGGPYRFTTTLPVRWVDVDSVGVVNHTIFLSLMEQARFEYFGRLGVLVDGQFPFVLGEATARFLAPGRSGMELTVGVRTTRLGGRSLDMDYQVSHQDRALCTCGATLVYVRPDLATADIPAASRQALAAFEGIDPGPTPAPGR